MKYLSVKLIEFYQTYLSFDRGLLSFLAPFGCCKYQPTCSEYTKSQIIKYGTLKGSYLGLQRIVSCR